ncbi:MAG TPA: heavy metal-associated domain-containing protein [Actinomycetaceae bacterium]|nr:heavy metal-associated domain-containing protein [Actinomycetaceae bacterium]
MANMSLQLLVDEMTCSNCVKHVKNALSELDEVHEVMITLRTGEPSQIVITLNSPVSEETLRETIDEAGYTLVGVEQR